jgi:hypothetical protein
VLDGRDDYIDELKRMWKKVVMAYFKGTVPQFAWRNWGNAEETSGKDYM